MGRARTSTGSILFAGLRIVQVIARRQFGVAFEVLGPQRFGNRMLSAEPFAEVHQPAAAGTERTVRTREPSPPSLARGAGNRFHGFGRTSAATNCRSLAILPASVA